MTYSADGYEETFAGNCLGHFLLVNLLLDSVAADGRIVRTASGAHDPALLDGKSVGKAVDPDAKSLAQQGRDGKPISGGRRYATSKLCIIMYAYELDRRLRRAGMPISSIAYDPGFLPDMGMGLGAPRHLPKLRSQVAFAEAGHDDGTDATFRRSSWNAGRGRGVHPCLGKVFSLQKRRSQRNSLFRSVL